MYLKSYCKILLGDNVNTYRTLFICKAYCKDLFNIELSMITGLSISKGATCYWKDDWLPTQIDLDIEIKDLYSQLSMTGYATDEVISMGIIKGSFKEVLGSIRQINNL